MDETPITVLQKQIRFYETFIDRLTTKEGLSGDVTQEKLDGLIVECKNKITEFNEAIKKLS